MLKRKGFTLIELLVVIAIIGLLSTLAVVALQNARAKARDAKRLADLNQIAKGLAVYYDQNGYYPSPDNPGGCTAGAPNVDGLTFYEGAAACDSDALCDWSALQTKLSGIIGVLPGDPLGGNNYSGCANTTLPFGAIWDDSYGYVYIVEDDGQSYDLIGRLENANSDEACGNAQYRFRTNEMHESSYLLGAVIDAVMCGGSWPAYFDELYSVPH